MDKENYQKVAKLCVKGKGWGYLIGAGGLNLSAEEAVKIQDDFGNWIVNTLNKK